MLTKYITENQLRNICLFIVDISVSRQLVCTRPKRKRRRRGFPCSHKMLFIHTKTKTKLARGPILSLNSKTRQTGTHHGNRNGGLTQNKAQG